MQKRSFLIYKEGEAMKRNISVLLIIIVLLLGGCGVEENGTKQEKEQVSVKETESLMDYSTFLKDYENVASKFELEGFEKVGDGELQHSCNIFPENSYFDDKNDMIDGDFNKPVKKNLYYWNKKEDILIYITHIYSYKPLEKHILTIDVPRDEIKATEIENVSGFYETFMSYHNTFVSLKVFYVGKEDGRSVLDESIDAITAYADILK